MTKMVGFPVCFDSRTQFREWVELARTAKERAVVSMDCTHSYAERMAAEGRCDRATAHENFEVNALTSGARVTSASVLPVLSVAPIQPVSLIAGGMPA